MAAAANGHLPPTVILGEAVGPYVEASFENGPDVAYLDNALDGQITECRKQVARVALLYDTLAREALSPRESVEQIKRMAQERT
jgi:hypothetical protein